MEKKTILILCKSNLSYDPRVLKQIEALVSEYKLITVGLNKSKNPYVYKELELFKVERTSNLDILFHVSKLKLQLYSKIYWTKNHKYVYNKLSQNKYHLIICNEIESLPIADLLAKEQNIPIYCDLHEYYLTDKKNGRFSKSQLKYEEWILLNHKSRIKHFTTVSPGIIDLYKNNYQINCTLLDNSCAYFNLQPRLNNPNKIRLVSHGACIPERKTELMIRMMDLLDDRFSLDLYLMNNNQIYKNNLIQLSTELPNGKVNIYDGIPFENIQSTLNKYDMGIFLIPPTHKNYQFTLPNKLFQFIQARIAIGVGPTPAMADIVINYNIGIVSPEFTPESMALILNNLKMEDINYYKKNTSLAALELNSGKNKKEIKNIVATLLS